MTKGYIKLHRSSLDNWMYESEPFTRWQAWVDILLNANFEKTTSMYRGQKIVTYPGQMRTSIRSLANRWQWSEGKVRRFLALLETEQMVHTECNANGTTLTVEKWAFYQIQRHTDRHTDEHTDRHTDGIHNKNDKEYIKNTQERACARVGAEYFLGLMNGEEDDD